MKRTLSLLVALILLVAVIGCSGEKGSTEKSPAKVATRNATQNTASASSSSGLAGQSRAATKIFRTVAPQEAKNMLETRKNLMLVDLREAKELREGYIDGSQFIPMSALAKGTKTLPADKPLLLVCAVGGRSYAVGRYYSGKGYQEIYNLKGGISAWKKAGLPVKRS